MPYKTIWEKRGVSTAWWGHATSAEMVRFVVGAQASPNFDGLHYSLHDFTDCESFTYELNEVAMVAALDSAGALSNSKIRIAVISNRDDVTHAVKAYLDTLLSAYPLEIFATAGLAREWIG